MHYAARLFLRALLVPVCGVRRPAWLGYGVALVLIALTASGCCCGLPGVEESPEARAAREAERQAAVGRAPARGAAFGRIASLIDPQATVPRVDCPTEGFIEARGGADALLLVRMPHVDYASLPAIDPPTEQAFVFFNAAFVSDLRVVSSDTASASARQLEEVGARNHRYLGVFVASERTPPVPEAAPHFTSGTFVGGVYIVDLDEGAVVCSVPFEAHSSGSVDYDEEPGLLAIPFDEAVMRDYRHQIREAAWAAVTQITPHAQLELPVEF